MLTAGEAEEPVEGPLTGNQYVICGTLGGSRATRRKSALEALGAKVSDSVSRRTTGVIAGEPRLEAREGAEGRRPGRRRDALARPARSLRTTGTRPPAGHCPRAR